MKLSRFSSINLLRINKFWFAKLLLVTVISLSIFQLIPHERAEAQDLQLAPQSSSLPLHLQQNTALLRSLIFFDKSSCTVKFQEAQQQLAQINALILDYIEADKPIYVNWIEMNDKYLNFFYQVSCASFGPMPLLPSLPTPVTPLSQSYLLAISSGNFTSYYSYLKNQINQNYAIQTEIKSVTSSMQFANSNLNRELTYLSLISKYGVTNLNNLATTSEGKKFLTWLFDNPDAINQFLLGGSPSNGKTTQALTIWRNIWSADAESVSGIYLTLAQAVALEHANPIITEWYQVDEKNKPTTIDPLSRYLNFKKAHKAKKLYPVFDTLDVEHMRMVVNATVTDVDLDWARETYTKPRIFMNERGVTRNLTKMFDPNTIGYAALDLEYNLVNAKGTSVFAGTLAYYGPNATLETVLKVGGVCGAIASYSSAVSQAYGVPALPMGQPGHAAMMFFRSDRSWNLYYDIFGLGESVTNVNTVIPFSLSSNYGPSYILLYEAAASKNPARLALSLRLGLLANELTNVKLAQEVRQKAIDLSPLAIPVWREYISALTKDSSTPLISYQTLSSQIITTFASQPRAMSELLALIEPQLIKSTEPGFVFNYVKKVTRTYDAITDIINPQQYQIARNVAKSVPTWYGDNLLKPFTKPYLSRDTSGKTQINGFSDGMSYSVDNGKTFTYPIMNADQKTYVLPADVQKIITSTKNVWVRYKYVTSTAADKAVILALP